MRRFRHRIDRAELVLWVSDEWLAFATENAARSLDAHSVLGRSLWSFIAGAEIRELYRTLFERARRSGAGITVPFRCDSPAPRRHMRLAIRPLEDGSLELIADLLREEERWVEVERAVRDLGLFEQAELPRITHAICAACFGEVGSL